MRTVALVPARLESTRLEKKLLRSISDLPLIVLTSKNLISSNLFDDVCVVTDSDEIIDVLKKHSINYLKSTKVYETGTDRIAEFANNFDCEIIINVQGEGVVGEFPILQPGECFEYTSGTPLKTTNGIMQGFYLMSQNNGDQLKIDIPAFSLDSPYNKKNLH